MALIVLPEKLPTWRTAWVLISPAQNGEEHTQLCWHFNLWFRGVFLLQTHFLRACEHCLMRKPFFPGESGEEKSRTQVPFLETGHIDYTFRIIRIEAQLSCSETTLFSQVTAGISPTVYPFLAICFYLSPNLGLVKVSWRQRSACSLISWGGQHLVKKVPVREKALMPPW